MDSTPLKEGHAMGRDEKDENESGERKKSAKRCGYY